MLNLGLMACAARLLPPAAALLGKQMLQVVSGDLPGRDDAGDSGIGNALTGCGFGSSSRTGPTLAQRSAASSRTVPAHAESLVCVS